MGTQGIKPNPTACIADIPAYQQQFCTTHHIPFLYSQFNLIIYTNCSESPPCGKKKGQAQYWDGRESNPFLPITPEYDGISGAVHHTPHPIPWPRSPAEYMGCLE
jgi:hypothetical protein